MAIVLPSKGSVEKYAVAELRRFVFEIGRTFGIVQYDKENSLKVIAKDLCKTIGGLSLRAAPTGHSQSQGSVGNVQRTSVWSSEDTVSQLQETTGLKLTSESPMFTWCVKQAQWLINRYLIGSDGKTAYSRRWSREYNGSLCLFGEWIDAKLPISNKVKIPKGGSQWFSGVYLGKDTEQMKSSSGMRMESSRSALSRGNRLLSNGMRLKSAKCYQCHGSPEVMELIRLHL